LVKEGGPASVRLGMVLRYGLRTTLVRDVILLVGQLRGGARLELRVAVVAAGGCCVPVPILQGARLLQGVGC
jgi:hypothetical protein